MQKLFIILLAACMFFAMSISAYAENVTVTPIDREASGEAIHLSPPSSHDAGTGEAIPLPISAGVSAYIEVQASTEVSARQASRTAITITDCNNAGFIRSQFPSFIEYEQDGYFGRLYLDVTTIQTRPDGPGTYTYTVTRTREITGLQRNDPSYIDRTWQGMTLTGVSFRQEINDRFTATAVYTGTATGRRTVSYITTATFFGEVTRIVN